MNSNSETNYYNHWEEKFKARPWGRYPPEDLVRLMGKQFFDKNKSDVSVLELGCGPGANLWFLHREGYQVAGIDISETAIELSRKRLAEENVHINPALPDLKVGSFATLPWPDNYFNVVVDIFALYANTVAVIKDTLIEVRRVMVPGALFYTKLWGRKTTGYGQGQEVEPGTYEDISSGPCNNMGLSHFFNYEEILEVFNQFDLVSIDHILRTDINTQTNIEEFHCLFKKAN